MAKTRVLLLGSGGIGTIAALNLECGNQAEVTAVLRSNFPTVIDRGFEIISCDHGHLHNWRPTHVVNAVPEVTHSSDVAPFDYIVCTTKNVPDIGPSVCDIIAPAVSPGRTVIVLIQNGLNIEKPFATRFPHNILLSGISRNDAHEIAPGVIEQIDHDKLQIGAFGDPSQDPATQIEAAVQFVQMYSAGGKTKCYHEPNVQRERWSKLVYNAAFNPISALTGLSTGDLQNAGNALDGLLIPAMNEVLTVAHAAGVDLPHDTIATTLERNPPQRKIYPSMQKDVTKGNFLEHEVIIGEVVREAQRRGIATPILSTLYHLCACVQWRTQQTKSATIRN
ncbi:ketopantoate reductase family protein [Aspergillus homomorphus CBS 101889]|uniref:2-dehydropantoate 2-reductase n=1 Tax=Aspergillus homomorphus (strain CBS 101889) TaxID=1450537 RepID=A0A395I4L8_ASPHC|nr:putative ketopantoate reductase [Aspergillus homomorphus CBS 101889]RAL14715.1 putative ketopantoate reductase [Aspergillus homomorphus CBS 101889]